MTTKSGLLNVFFILFFIFERQFQMKNLAATINTKKNVAAIAISSVVISLFIAALIMEQTVSLFLSYLWFEK